MMSKIDSKTNRGFNHEALQECLNSYELNLHFKQGDDFKSFLDDTDGDIPKALKKWAAFMKRNAEQCKKLARAIKTEITNGSKIEVNADTHMIAFYGEVKALDRIAKSGLIRREVIDP